MSISQEKPPDDVPNNLSNYLARRFGEIGWEINKTGLHPEQKQMPRRPPVGSTYYFGDPATHNYDAAITSEGLWLYKVVTRNVSPTPNVYGWILLG